MSSDKTRVFHELAPVFDEKSRVLILGTMPSPKSREAGFYYMHPQNRFWKTLCAVLGEPLPDSIEGRREMCLKRGIALWDVLASCDIIGASDSSIKNAVPNNLDAVFTVAEIRAVFTTGKKAKALYDKFFPNNTPAVCLPSTSPANRAVSDMALIEKYAEIKRFL